MGLRHLKRSPLYIVSVLALGACLPLDVGAWGFGRAQTSAVLGVPLDFNVALRLEQGEAPPECLTVDVTVGDIPLPRSAVSAVLDTSSPSPLVRVRTSQAIDEPLVQVNLSAGCSSRVTRRFTLLADPPGHMAAPALANAEALASTVPNATTLTQAPAAVAAAAPAGPVLAARGTPAVNAVSGSAPDGSGRATAAAAAAPAASGPSGQASSNGADSAGSTKRQPILSRKSAVPAQLADAKVSAADRPVASAPARPRLQLDAPTIATKAAGAGPEAAKSAAVLAAEEAASAARAAASAAEARAAAMEKNIEALRQEAKANRESLARLTQALQEARSTPDVPIAMWGAMAGLGALCALLMIRLRRQRLQTGATPWWSPGSSAATESVAAVDVLAGAGAAAPGPSFEGSVANPLVVPPATPHSTPADPRAGTSGFSAFAATPATADGLGLSATRTPRDLPPLPDPEELDSPPGPMERTQLLPPSASSVSAPIQGVSIEELLDLEQQVEFFTVLGQDDAALSLLVEHLRSTGGTYPLPYLKLLEIYRRKGDEDSYERTRDRFNQRFNAVVPAWGAPTALDRHLEDLPDVLRRIQQVWPRPVDAMALLENMLVRTEGGTLLEMSALGEVLFLFTLARDLHEQEEGSAGPVDVLLPLDDLFDTPPAQLTGVAADPATQFSVFEYDKLAPTAAVAGFAGAAGAAAAQTASVESETATHDGSHFDLPLDEPMFEPVFDAPAATSDAQSLASGQRMLPASIDLPTFSPSPERSAEDRYAAAGADSQEAAVARAPLGLDLAFGGDSASSSEDAVPTADPFLEPLSFDLPDLEALQEPLPPKSATAGPVDLDISLDGLELEPVAPKLSPGEEQAASNFGLFLDSPSPGKSR